MMKAAVAKLLGE
jgi:hypothetical protein